MRKLIYPVLAICVVFVLSSCGTAPKKQKEEIGGIKSRVDTLETRVDSVESRQAEVERMTGEQAQAFNEMKSVKTNISVKAPKGKKTERTRDIQTALKNAGYYYGKIDGIKGKKTKAAIKEFQAANGLVADGIVGRKTWEVLSRYLNQSASYGVEGGSVK